jgi:hypothetical protein
MPYELPVYELQAVTLGSAQNIDDTGTDTTSPLVFCDLTDSNKQMQGFRGAMIHFSAAVSGGSTDNTLDINFYCAIDGATKDTHNYTTQTQLTTLDAATHTFTINVEAKDYGRCIVIFLKRSAGDRTMAVTTTARRWRYML